jgi:hypothetical protein
MKATRITQVAKIASLVGLCMLGAMVPQAKADEFNQKTIMTFSGPVEVPGKVLDAGTYVFKLTDSQSDRDIVQVYNKNENKLYGTFLTVPDYRLKPTDKPVVTFAEQAAGTPEAVKTWFYPGDNYGHEFVYPKRRAAQLAKANNTPVPSIPDESAVNTATIKQAPLKVQQPSGEEVEVAEVFVTPPPAEQPKRTPTVPAELPKTASALPLIGLISLLSLGMAISLRLAAAKAE